MSETPSVSIVIPTLNAARWLPALFDQLREQTPVKPMEILLVDSGSTDATRSLAEAEPLARVISIEHFTHGGARNLGIREARGDIVVLMTQDATPRDVHWLAPLIYALNEPGVAAVYSRQVPREDASAMERFFLSDRFPAGELALRTHQGSEPPVYPETFFSNVSAAARRATWQQFPFDETLLMSEDQQFTRDALMAGRAIAYQPASVVVHSHRYTLWQTFKRYFDSVIAFRQLNVGHDTGSSARLGGLTFLNEVRYLFLRYPWWLPYYVLYQGFKAAGVLAAHAAPHLPRSWCARCSLNPGWWRLDKRR